MTPDPEGAPDDLTFTLRADQVRDPQRLPSIREEPIKEKVGSDLDLGSQLRSKGKTGESYDSSSTGGLHDASSDGDSPKKGKRRKSSIAIEDVDQDLVDRLQAPTESSRVEEQSKQKKNL